MEDRINPPLPVGERHFMTEKVGISADEYVVRPRLDGHYGPWESKDAYLAWIRGITSDPTYIPESGVVIGVTQTDGTVKDYKWQKPYDEEGYWEDDDPAAVNISGAVYFNTIEAMKASTELNAGDIAITKGYYSANDGGGSTFRIISSSTYAGQTWRQAISGETCPYLDDATLVELQNGLYANILVPANMEVNFLQMGARKMSLSSRVISSKKYYYIHHPDNKPYMMRWLAFNDRRKTTFTLFIPEGVYSFSETWLLRSENNSSALGIRLRGECMQSSGGGATKLIPHYQSQKYILRVGYRTNDIGYTGSVTSMPMRKTMIKDISFGTTKYAWTGDGYTFQGLNFSESTSSLDPNDDATSSDNFYRYVTRGALWLDSCPYSQFDGLYFSNVAGTCMYLTQCYESHFGYINIRDCGRMTATGYSYALVRFNAPGPSDISACYFYYFNFEGCMGNYFYSYTRNFTHCEFNNIQIEGSIASLPSNSIGAINTLASSVHYDTDSDYSTPSVGEGEVFGKWIKWFVFTGNMGFMPNYINSISASNFGNGFKKYRTYSLSDGNIVDADGNIITGGYVLENGTYYAVDGSNNKIVDFYRYYALFGQDENSGQDFLSFVWNIGTVYLYRYSGMDDYCGPWVVYLRSNATTHHLTVGHVFDRRHYPFYLEGIKKCSFSKESCNIPSAIPFADMLNSGDGSQTMTYTRSGTCSPNGLCVKRLNAFSFMLAPNKTYYLRAYLTTSGYNNLMSHYSRNGHPLLKWNGLLCIGDTSTPYTGNADTEIMNTGWVTIPLPDLGLTKVTRVYLYKPSGAGDAYCNSFISGLYLDVLIG